jgi:hypothetical protein
MLFKAVGADLPSSFGYTQKLVAASADLQSAPLNYGSVIRLNVYNNCWITNPELKSANCKLALAAASFYAYSEELGSCSISELDNLK